ncbi:MAG: DUF447 family protein [Candidatus Bathyarchaeota archaeon]|nr:DUF447 family protein [Candidatus Bathyarchaeota archaeon]
MKPSELEGTLQRLGFTENSIVEIIMITTNLDGSYNPAPMGVIKTGDHLEVRPFTTSNTYRNLTRNSLASINLTTDPFLFLKTAFKHELSDGASISELSLRGSDATIVVEKVGEDVFSSSQASVILRPNRVVIHNDSPTVYSRGRAMAIEAIIHATRVPVYQSRGDEAKVESLLRNMRYCFDVISRVSEVDSPEMQVADSLRTLLAKWGVSI